MSGKGSASCFLSPVALGGMCQYVTLSVPLWTILSCPITVLVYITVWRCSQALHEPMCSMNTLELQHCLAACISNLVEYGNCFLKSTTICNGLSQM